MSRRGGGWWVAVALLVLLVLSRAPTCAGAAADLVFRVPEVLVRHAAAERAVGTAQRHTAPATTSARPVRSATTAGTTGTTTQSQVDEYFIEHDVSTLNARRAAALLNVEDESGAGCGSCSRRDLEYCEAHVLADHCYCERRFMPEPFPWLPHTCYLGPEPCRPRAGDCARYARLRDCCCYKRMALKWKSILSRAPRVGASSTTLVLLALVQLTLCIHSVK